MLDFFSHVSLIAIMSGKNCNDCIQDSNKLKWSLLTIERMFKQALVKFVALVWLFSKQNL